MPIQLSSSRAIADRRAFLAASLVAAGYHTLLADDAKLTDDAKVEADRFALLADTHIAADPQLESRGVKMTALLASTVKQLLERERRCAAAFVFGDCAYLDGQPGDYRQLAKLLQPLGEQQWTIHLALGNHDHRARCMEAFPAGDGPLVAKLERRVEVVQGKQANWFLLDSLDQVNSTPGKLGTTQLEWLAEELDRHADRPALIGVHHNPVSATLPSPGKVAGLVDTADLFKVIDGRRFVKAVFFGHTHAWSVLEHAGIHLVNLPPVAYAFTKDKPNGWVDCLLSEDRAELTMHCHDAARPEHNRPLELKWRKG